MNSGPTYGCDGCGWIDENATMGFQTALRRVPGGWRLVRFSCYTQRTARSLSRRTRDPSREPCGVYTTEAPPLQTRSRNVNHTSVCGLGLRCGVCVGLLFFHTKFGSRSRWRPPLVAHSFFGNSLCCEGERGVRATPPPQRNRRMCTPKTPKTTHTAWSGITPKGTGNGITY